ncbi:MAG: MltA domain-containing protein [Pseudomonadota bacterium]
MIAIPQRHIVLFFFFSAIVAASAAVLVFGGIIPPHFTAIDESEAFADPELDFELASFEGIEGWRFDDPQGALIAFRQSCALLMQRDPAEKTNSQEYLGAARAAVSIGGFVRDWRAPCEAAESAGRQIADLDGGRADIARAVFEAHFTPIRILSSRPARANGPAPGAAPLVEPSGLFTGYYETIFRASAIATDIYSAPVYPRPDDLVDVDLGAFRPELAGQRIAGKVQGNRLAPYADRSEINAGDVERQGEPIAWMDPNDLFFLQIQGSGRLVFEDGARMRVGYAGQNGHAYRAIGAVLVERRVMPLKNVSMQSIRDWLDNASPQSARELREQNASYVFFRVVDEPPSDVDQGPVGAGGVPLTAGRSLAVDRRYHAMGAPVWVDIDAADGSPPLRRLMIAQDTGGAIKGPIRGDVFWGTGVDAGAIAGGMRDFGSIHVLVPNGIAARLFPPLRS